MRIDLYQWNLLEIMKGKLDLLLVHVQIVWKLGKWWIQKIHRACHVSRALFVLSLINATGCNWVLISSLFVFFEIHFAPHFLYLPGIQGILGTSNIMNVKLAGSTVSFHQMRLKIKLLSLALSVLTGTFINFLPFKSSTSVLIVFLMFAYVECLWEVMSAVHMAR